MQKRKQIYIYTIMKLSLRMSLLLAAMMMLGSNVTAQEKKQEPLKYVNAQELRIINKGFTDTNADYTRLPSWIEDSIRPGLWNRAQCSAGIGIRFATNSKRVGVKYHLLWNTHMLHMADTGLKGTDLYRLSDDGVWEYVNTNRPNADVEKMCEKIYV